MVAAERRSISISVLNIVWFKRDLRIHDHAALAQASAHGRVLPLYVIEPELWLQPDTSARQWEFAAECLCELREDLGKLGQPLILRVGDVTDVLGDLLNEFGCFRLWSHEETGNSWTYQRDLKVAEWTKLKGIEWTEIQDEGVIWKLNTRNGWAGKWNAQMSQPTTPAPTRLEPMFFPEIGRIPDSRELGLQPASCPGRQSGGRKAAQETLRLFLHERGRPYRRAMSSPSLGAVHCSRMSPHLAWGTVSMREVEQAARSRQQDLKATGEKGGWRGSMSSFVPMIPAQVQPTDMPIPAGSRHYAEKASLSVKPMQAGKSPATILRLQKNMKLPALKT